MPKEEIYLTYFELIHTTGFINIISIVWIPSILCLFIYHFTRKLKERR